MYVMQRWPRNTKLYNFMAMKKVLGLIPSFSADRTREGSVGKCVSRVETFVATCLLCGGYKERLIKFDKYLRIHL